MDEGSAQRSLPSTVFVSEYLNRLRESDEGPGGAEAELEGPWRVEADGDRWAVVRDWERLEHGHRPLAILRSRERALVLAALLPALGREVLVRLRDAEDGYVLESGGEEEGEIFRYHDRLAEGVHLIGHLIRSPRSLAHLLRAAGPTAQELVGQMLAEGEAV